MASMGVWLVTSLCFVVMMLISHVYHKLLDAYEQSATLSDIEYSWFFRLLLNLVGYSTVLLPMFILYKYLQKINYFDKISNNSGYTWRVLFLCFGEPGEKLPESVKPRKEDGTARESAELAFCFTGLMAAYLVWGLLQEKIMTQNYVMSDGSLMKFNDSQFLVFVKPNVLSAWCQYEALKYVSFPTQVTYTSRARCTSSATARSATCLAPGASTRRSTPGASTRRSSTSSFPTQVDVYLAAAAAQVQLTARSATCLAPGASTRRSTLVPVRGAQVRQLPHAGGRILAAAAAQVSSYCSLSNVLSAWCQYEALKYVSFPTQPRRCTSSATARSGNVLSAWCQYEALKYVSFPTQVTYTSRAAAQVQLLLASATCLAPGASTRRSIRGAQVRQLPHAGDVLLAAPLHKFSYCSLSNVLSAWCQYEALKYVSFPTQVTYTSRAAAQVQLLLAQQRA
ncbi:unnamed protein product [Arctia plantaginis]|uniref:Adenosine 3'-phospho 5'-phosphosulfate transporter 1 n=1 Tax=Arctia plantaginis TaxID=874455 RepID=A0A8S1AZR7_ARCPL|nr:unnamed protein product [Arctia plantaginis]